MVLIFPWGTVKDTPTGVSFGLSRGVHFNLRRSVVDLLAEYIGGKIPKGMSAAPMIAMGVADLRLVWDPPLPTTVKSVLKVGYDNKSIPNDFDPKRTPTLLNRDEAKELSDAIFKIMKSVAPRPAPAAHSVP